MAKMIRNCRLPTQTLANQGSAVLAFFMREAFLLAGWTEFANNGDPDWSAVLNQVFLDDLGVPGFAVLAANPRQVTHSGAPFTAGSVGMVLALKATNDRNWGMFRITDYINTSTVLVDWLGAPPEGWINESGIPGRILNYGAAVHTTGAWVELDPPAGNNRARIVINLANYVECYAQPRAGLGLTTNTPSTAVALLYDDDDLKIALNAYFENNDALFYKFADDDGTLNVAMWGELDDAPTEDTFPGFVLTGANAQASMLFSYRIDMLSSLSYTPIRAYSDVINVGTNASVTTYNQDDLLGRRLRNGRPGFALLRKPNVVLDDIVNEGAFVRGRLPIMRQTTTFLDNWAPVDAQGQWLHLASGVCVPRGGPYVPHLYLGM